MIPIANSKSPIENPPEPLPLSLLNDFLYCPRRAALKLVEGWREANEHTERGDIVHEHSDLAGYESQVSNSKSQIVLLRALPVFSTRLGLSGKCDIVEVEVPSTSNLKSQISSLKSAGIAAHAALKPVEFKLGKRRQWDNDDAQLCAQALCLEEMFGVTVPRGAVFHADSKRRREVEFTAELRARAEQAVRELHALLRGSQISNLNSQMPDIIQNTLYLTTSGTFVNRDHLTLQVEVPVFPADLAPDERTRDKATSWRKLSIPIHHLESICAFGPITITPPALDLCWEQGVAVNFLSESGYLQARLTGVADSSVILRRTQFRAADDPSRCAAISRQIIAGKLQNSRHSLLRGARESEISNLKSEIERAADALGRQLQELGRWTSERLREPGALDHLRGVEGMGSVTYFGVFSLLLKQQREDFIFTNRSRRPPRDRINCLLSFLYALVRHDSIAALTSIGLDPFAGFLHSERPNRPALALDLMEEFRPWLADRLALTLINRQQIGPEHFNHREGGAVEFTDAGRKLVKITGRACRNRSLNARSARKNGSACETGSCARSSRTKTRSVSTFWMKKQSPERNTTASPNLSI